MVQFKKSDYIITVSDKIGEQLDIKNKKTIYNGIKLFDHNKYKINLHNKYHINKGDFIIYIIIRRGNGHQYYKHKNLF